MGGHRAHREPSPSRDADIHGMWLSGRGRRNRQGWLEACTPKKPHTAAAVELPGGSMSQPTNASLSPLAQTALTVAPDTLVSGSASQHEQPFDPSAEDAYWRDNYIHRPYADQTLSYDYYRPAYRYGWESRARFL